VDDKGFELRNAHRDSTGSFKRKGPYRHNTEDEGSQRRRRGRGRETYLDLANCQSKADLCEQGTDDNYRKHINNVFDNENRDV
jgi:hypothetical protein